MSAQILKLPAPEGLASLPEQLPAGRLLEIASAADGAQMTLAIACLRHAQAQGETAAWVQPAGGALFPPDLSDSGIDLDALLVVNVPVRAGLYGPIKAAEILLRSGGFGWVALDLRALGSAQHAKLLHDSAWQGRLLGLAREHTSSVLLLSDGSTRSGSLGPLISVCVEPHRTRIARGLFALTHRVRKDKSGLLGALAEERRRGPHGLL